MTSRNFKCEKIFKQIYPATYNFRNNKAQDYTSDPTTLEFVDGANLYNGSLAVVSSWQNHRNILRLQDDATAGEDPFILHNEIQSLNGTREFWIGTNNVNGNWWIYYYESGNNSIVVLKIQGGDLIYVDSGGTGQTIQAVSNDTLYHLKVVWRSDNTFDLYVDGIKKVDNVATRNNMIDGIDQLYLRGYGDSADYLYFDSYGDVDNDPQYQEGDNIYWREFIDSVYHEDWGYYPATYNFRNDTIGNVPSGWTDNSTINGSVAIAAELNRHLKILKLYDPDANSIADIEKTITQQANQTIEFWIAPDSVAASKNCQIDLKEAALGDNVIRLRTNEDDFQYYQDGVGWTNIKTACLTANIFTHIKIILDDSNNQFDCYIDGELEGDNLSFENNSIVSVNGIRFRTIGSQINIFYIDAIGISADSNYNIGDNRFWYSLSATHDFEDEDIGTNGSNIDFIDNVDLPTCVIIQEVGIHKKILKLSSDTTWQYAFSNFVGQASGVIEFWIKREENNLRCDINFRNAGTTHFAIRWHSDGKIYYFDGDWKDTGEIYVANAWYHIKIEFDVNTNWHLWINNISIDGGSGYGYTNSPTEINRFYYTCGGDTGETTYLDAIGYSWYSDYYVGQNKKCYRASISQFEKENIGNAKRIEFVDAYSVPSGTSLEIVPSFDEHKKVLEFNDQHTSFTVSAQNFFDEQIYGTVELWIKTTGGNFQILIDNNSTGTSLWLQIAATKLQYFYGGYIDICDYTHNIWHHLRIDFDCEGGYRGLTTDHFYVYLDGVKYGEFDFSQTGSSMKRLWLRSYDTTTNITRVDAISYSWEPSCEIADNRIFEYHPLSMNDITDEVLQAEWESELYNYDIVSILTKTTTIIKQDEHLIRLRNKCDSIVFIGNVEKGIKDPAEGIYDYPLYSITKGEIEEHIDRSFSSSKTHEMLYSICPNLSQEDGSLILADWEIGTTNYQYEMRNLPRRDSLKFLASLEDRIISISPEGKIYYFQAKNSGISVLESDYKLVNIPLLEQIMKAINYVKIYGGWDSDTGKRFIATSIDSESYNLNGYIGYWARFPQIFDQDTLDALVLAIRTRTGFADNPYYCYPDFKEIDLKMVGQTINFKHDGLGIPQKDWYILAIRMNMDTAIMEVDLSSGMVEEGEFMIPPHLEVEGMIDDEQARIYTTDINTVFPTITPGEGAVFAADLWHTGIKMTSVDDYACSCFFFSDKVDALRDARIILTFGNGNNGSLTFDGEMFLYKCLPDGSHTQDSIEIAKNCDLEFSENYGFAKYIYTLSASDISTDYMYKLFWKSKENLTIYYLSCMVEYYIKRSIV